MFSMLAHIAKELKDGQRQFAVGHSGSVAGQDSLTA
jgi:hypothetical protein